MATDYPADLLSVDGMTIKDQVLIDFTDPANQPSPTPGQPGTSIVRGPYPFTFATAGLTTGVALFTPTIGDLILDFWIEIDTAFDGTTPLADIGTFSGGNSGLLAGLASATVDLTAADVAVPDNAGVLASFSLSSLSAAVLTLGAVGTEPENRWQLAVTAANPLLLVVSQDGTKGGTATGATAGAGQVFVQTATPLGR